MLGFSPDSALIYNGTFRVIHEKDSDRPYEFIRFNEFILSWEGESLKTKIYIPGDEIETGIPEVVNSLFDVEVFTYLDKLDVKASFDLQITDISSGPFSIFFRYPMDIQSVKANGKDLYATHRYFKASGNSVHQCLVDLGDGHHQGDLLTITFEYSLDYSMHALGRKQVGIDEDRGYVVLEAGWYPWFENRFKTIPAQISVTLPDSLMAICPGKLLSVDRMESNRMKFNFDKEESTWPFIVWGNYSKTTLDMEGMGVDLFLLSNSRSESETLGSQYRKIIKELSEYFPDPDFSYQRIVEVDRKGGYGPTGNLLIESTYLEKDKISDYETIELLSHELTHAWINSLCRPGGKFESFISEGLATYIGAETVRNMCGELDAYSLWSRNYRAYSGIREKAVAPSAVTDELMYSDNSVYRGVVYFKGAYFFKLLEEFSGHEDFVRILKGLLLTENELFSMDDLRSTALKINGRDYPFLFEDYLNTTVFPDDESLIEFSEKYIDVDARSKILGAVVSVLFYLDNNDSEGVLSVFSKNNELVGPGIRNNIANAANSWPYTNTRVEPGHFYLMNEKNIEYVFPVFLSDKSGQTRTSVRTVFRLDSDWELTDIHFGQY